VSDQLPEWLRASGEGLVLQLHIQPGAKRTELVGSHGDALKIRLAAPPVDGRANAALLDFLAGRLGLPGRDLRLIAGDTSRRKRVAVSGLPAAELLQKLAAPD
jgi:uncharacterized protein (TIGR00251 family)